MEEYLFSYLFLYPWKLNYFFTSITLFGSFFNERSNAVQNDILNNLSALLLAHGCILNTCVTKKFTFKIIQSFQF